MAKPTGYSIKIEGLDDLLKDVSRAGSNLRATLTQAMQRSTTRLKNEIQSNVTSKGINFQGNLRRSVQVHEATASRGVVGVGEKYGGAVEFGRSPGKMPPVAPLERWAAIKLGAPGAGFVIARKIARSGTKPQPFVEPAFKANIEYIFDQFEQAGKIIVQQMAGK